MKARMAAVVLGAGLLGAGLLASPSADADPSVNVGALSCHVSGGVGFIFGSSKELDCVFKHTNGDTERYHGEINKYGVDIGKVVAPIAVGQHAHVHNIKTKWW